MNGLRREGSGRLGRNWVTVHTGFLGCAHVGFINCMAWNIYLALWFALRLALETLNACMVLAGVASVGGNE